MKTKLITILTICVAFAISLCNMELKQAKAEEEPVEQSETITLTNNLFEKFSYDTRRTVSNGLDPGLIVEGNTPYSNLMTIDEEKEMIISMSFLLDNTSLDDSKSVSINDTSFLYFDEKFEAIQLGNVINYKGSYLNDLIIDGYYEFNASGEIITFTYYIHNPSKFVENAKYFIINPNLKYYVNDRTNAVTQNYTTIQEMYVGFIDETVYGDVLMFDKLEIDYTRKQNVISWTSELIEISSNYLTLNTKSNTKFSDFVANISALDSSGSKLKIEWGSIEAESLHEEGREYGYIMRAVDSNGNDDFIVIYFKIGDSTAPKIYGSKEYTSSNTTKISVDALKNTLTVTDNVDLSKDIIVTLKYDYYSKNYDKVGEYFVCFTATDTSGNSADFIIKINVIDNEKPKFYNLYGERIAKFEVIKSCDSVLTLSDILSKVQCVDNSDGELEIKVYKDEYTNNGDIAGTYLIVFYSKDSSGNYGVFNVNVTVTEEMPSKTIVLDKRYIIVENNTKLSRQDFFKIMNLCGLYSKTTTSYTTITSDVYNASPKLEGDYIIEYQIVTTSGNEMDGIFNVQVVSARSKGALINEAEEDGFIMTILKWIINLFVTFFEWIGKIFK